MTELIAWIGSVCFMLCGIPQVVQCMEEGNARGLSSGLLCLWAGGEICYIVATVQSFGPIEWMLANYIINLVCITILIGYKVHDWMSHA